MTTAYNLMQVEALQRACDHHHLIYSTDGHYVTLSVDHKVYPSFSKENIVTRVGTVEEALWFVTGLTSMFGEVMRKDLEKAGKEKP